MELALVRCDELVEGQLHPVQVGPRRVVLLRLPDGVAAFDGACPHRGAELARGSLDGAILTCCWHGWRFDARTGAGISNPHGRLRMFPVREEEGRVFVSLPDTW
jgi:nitrite reductase/ring-hydroxylating ferredoxin subunit